MNQEYVAGQRWISDTESDLGLGTILEVEHRQITVVFLATGDTRIYAKETAPLTRVAFHAGDSITSHEGWQLVVEAAVEEDGLLTYRGRRLDTGEPATLDESGLDNFLQFRTPRDRLFAGLIDGQRWFSLRRAVFDHRHQLAHSAAYGLMGARVSVLPHQVYIAVEALKRRHPRVLLADEVGLGKTIEAGMILHASLITNQVSRVLIIVPSALLHQWLVEMLRKFNLKMSIMDEERYTESLPSAPEGNPFLAEQLVLTSLDTLLENDEIGDAAIAAGFDMMIVDEAHHLSWQPDAPSSAYTLVESLALETPSVLLLTATPEQLGQAGHFARLRLLDPERFASLEQFIKEEDAFSDIAQIANQLMDDQALDATAVGELQTLLGEEFSDSEQKTLSSSSAIAASDLKFSLIDKLIDRHGTGRLLFRNTRQAIQGFPVRQFNAYSLDDDSNDSKAAWLLEFLSDLYPAKVLLICSSINNVKVLGEKLRVMGFASAHFHEEMSIVERDRAAAWFADPEEDCRLLLCSEIGSEGRNFQFLHDLVMLELPDSPDLLEQRIGRLDRIGQTETVQIHVPAAVGSRDEALRRWYHEGLDAFEHIAKSGNAVRNELGVALESILEKIDTGAQAPELDALIVEAKTLAASYDAQLEQGRDRLLELNSNRPARIQEHLDALARVDRDYRLQDFMEAVFDRFGVDVTEQRDHWIIHPSDHMQVEHFPHLPAAGMSVTFDRASALTREEFTYLTWDHPMVTAAMDLILDEGYGQADSQVVRIEELPKGLAFVEASYNLQCVADRQLNIERYLPARVQSFVVGNDGKDYTSVVQDMELDNLKLRYDRNALRKVVLKNRDTFEQLIAKTNQLAEATVPESRSKAREAIDKEHATERQRLVSLARVNSLVKEDEINELDARHTALLDALEGTHTRPVSIRIVFNN